MDFKKYYTKFYNVIQELPEGPLFSKFEINPSELCNRVCSFCPRGVDYPNKNIHISLEVINKIAQDLDDLNFKGLVEICGNGEPLLSKNLIPLIKKLQKFEILLVTNGDRLTVKKIKELSSYGVNYFLVSLYDGKHQIDEFDKKFSECGMKKDKYWLRNYWKPDPYFNNRAGSLEEYKNDRKNKACNILHYQMNITVNGNIEFCCHTAWKNDFYHGNIINSSLKKIWYGKRMTIYRKLLEKGRNHKPCQDCSVIGTRYGQNFVDKWQKVVKS